MVLEICKSQFCPSSMIFCCCFLIARRTLTFISSFQSSRLLTSSTDGLQTNLMLLLQEWSKRIFFGYYDICFHRVEVWFPNQVSYALKIIFKNLSILFVPITTQSSLQICPVSHYSSVILEFLGIFLKHYCSRFLNSDCIKPYLCPKKHGQRERNKQLCIGDVRLYLS